MLEYYLTQLSLPLVLILAVVVTLVMRSFSRGAKQRQHNADAAQALGMHYEAPKGGATGASIDEGTHHFSGTTQGVEWKIETELLAQTDSDGHATSHLDRACSTRWTAPLCATGGGSLLLMNIPKGVSSAIPATNPNSTGLLASIAAKAASLALKVYVSGVFGSERIAGLQLKPEHRLALPDNTFSQSYAVFCDNPALMGRLQPAAHDWLLNAHAQGVSMLWDDKGLTLTWPTPHVKPLDVAACAENSAALAGLLPPQFTNVFYQLPQGDSPYTTP